MLFETEQKSIMPVRNFFEGLNLKEAYIAAQRGRDQDNPSYRGSSNSNFRQRLEVNKNGLCNTLTHVQKDNYVLEPNPGANGIPYRIRKLTGSESLRLMGVSDSNICLIAKVGGIPFTQQCKLAGNSIVVDVLEHIFRKLFIDKGNDNAQMNLF